MQRPSERPANMCEQKERWDSTKWPHGRYREQCPQAAVFVWSSFPDWRDPKDLEPAFEAMVRQHAEALVVLTDGFMTINRATLAQLAAKYRIPAIYGHNLYTTAGGLMSYGPSLDDLYRRAASYVDKILKGSKPADLPVEQPVRFYLIINLRTAKDLGLSIPQKVLTAADEVIE